MDSRNKSPLFVGLFALLIIVVVLLYQIFRIDNEDTLLEIALRQTQVAVSQIELALTNEEASLELVLRQTRVAVSQTESALTAIPTLQALEAADTDVCRVPQLVGLRWDIAENLVRRLALQPVIDVQYATSSDANLVISQEPPSGTRLEPCEGDVFLTVNLGATPVPLTPSATSTPIILPATPAPPSDLRLFWDDFDESKVKPEWGATGNFSVNNANLIVAQGGGFFQSNLIGDSTWRNYSVAIQNFGYTPYSNAGTNLLQLQIRVKDSDNYMMLECQHVTTAENCQWYKIEEGQITKILDGTFSSFLTQTQVQSAFLRLEFDGNIYRTIFNGELVNRFEDSTFSNGGIKLLMRDGQFQVGSFVVTAMP